MLNTFPPLKPSQMGSGWVIVEPGGAFGSLSYADPKNLVADVMARRCRMLL